jgi:hypothetical protein
MKSGLVGAKIVLPKSIKVKVHSCKDLNCRFFFVSYLCLMQKLF